jgi:hypothetical protein
VGSLVGCFGMKFTVVWHDEPVKKPQPLDFVHNLDDAAISDIYCELGVPWLHQLGEERALLVSKTWYDSSPGSTGVLYSLASEDRAS